LSALLAHGHVTIALVRTPSKLPPHISNELSVEHGDARSASDIRKVIFKHKCEAIVNTAGYAAMAPWGKSDLPTIVEAVAAAAISVANERGHPLRVWFLGGLGLLDTPAQKYRIVD
jgi:hypothetical protein